MSPVSTAIPPRQKENPRQKSKSARSAISPRRDQNFSEWYQQVIPAAELAENSVVRGCMVIRPWGYGIWEHVQRVLDALLKATGHENAYFPLFIPLSYLQKEAEHVKGFAKECAVVTHHRLEQNAEGKLVPASPLTEPLIVRPTSETIIGESFSRWAHSYRDLPLLINQWCNVVRWEMRTRMFLRTAEFLWQEGHTAHATEKEAREETARMLNVYAHFARDYLAMPTIQGCKTPSERFPGAVETFCIEAMMQDRRALQAGTSHFLGQKFAKGSGIKFLDESGNEQYAWTTSWGMSTRIIGGLIMTHGDDDGLVLPPRVAPQQVVIVPVIHSDEVRQSVLSHCDRLAGELRKQRFDGEPVRVKVDARESRGGEKAWSWVKKGVPLRVEVGPRDVQSDSVVVRRRDRSPRERQTQPRAVILDTVGLLLEEIQAGLLERARSFRREHTHRIDSRDDFYAFFTPRNAERPGIHGGFAYSHWNGSAEVEERIKKDLGVTIRCIPEGDEWDCEPGRCVITGEPSTRRVIFAKSY